MQIIELKTDAQWEPLYPLIKQLNQSVTKKQFQAMLKSMLQQGYRCIAAVEKGHYIGACGFWYGTRFWCGDFIDLDNVVVDKNTRGKGVGKKLVAWVEKEAKRLKCNQVGLDCYTSSTGAHKFYHREGFIIKGYHFIKLI